ncbi:hypothetical protein Tco_0189940 [Tanacetum coccineum]
MKIHHNGEFLRAPERRYKVDVLDYVDLIDCDMFFIHELVGMLGELSLGDNNKILYTHFRTPGMSLDDGLVSLMTDEDVIKLLNYVPMYKEIKVYIEIDVSLVQQHLVELLVSQSKCVGNGVVIEEIVEDNVISTSGKESRLLMLEWSEMGKEEEHVDTSTHASTSDVCPVVESRNDENVGNLYCDNEIHEKVLETLMSDYLFQQDSFVDWQQDPYHFVNEQQEIAEMAAELNHRDEEVFFQTSGAQVDPCQDIDEEVVEMKENVDDDEEEECFIGGDESDFQKDGN